MSEIQAQKSNVADTPSQLILCAWTESPVRNSHTGRQVSGAATPNFPNRDHNSRQTKILSYFRLKDENGLGKAQSQVYSFISSYPKCSDREIMKGTGLAINCVCGRRNELVKMGYVIDAGVKHDERTNRLVTIWRVR